jgi:phage N-6-adenine-methyltransferase
MRRRIVLMSRPMVFLHHSSAFNFRPPAFSAVSILSRAWANTQPIRASNPRTGFTHEVEWYTPTDHVEAAREVLGQIDLDPASSETANLTVRARWFYSLCDNGLTKKWFRKVFLNPPFVHPTKMQFMQKLVDEISAGRVTEAIAITANFTDTGWFHLAVNAADAVCFTRGRINFVDPAGNRTAPTQGNLVFYFGGNVDRFAEVFKKFGTIVRLRDVVAWVPPSRTTRSQRSVRRTRKFTGSTGSKQNEQPEAVPVPRPDCNSSENVGS